MAKTYKVSGNVEKIVCPVICVIDGVEKEYPNGKALYADFFEKDYSVASFDVKEGKIVVQLQENPFSRNGATNWIGEEMYVVPQFDPDEEWVKKHREQFGEDPSFF